MADHSVKVPENVSGRYFVDRTCIDCELCREKAPANFVRQDKGRYSYVLSQPASPPEIAECEAALLECPVEAIGREDD